MDSVHVITFPFFLCLTNARIKTPARTTTTMSSVCPKCGTIGKSGKSSCCGRGGSWFRNCGRAGNAKHGHTWFEGIRTCKTLAQSKASAIGKESNAAQQQTSSDESDCTFTEEYDVGTVTSKATTTAVTIVPTMITTIISLAYSFNIHCE